MKSNVIIDSADRELCGLNVRQRTKDGWLCLSDVIQIVNIQRLKADPMSRSLDFKLFIKQQNISEFIQALERKIDQKPYIMYSKQTPGWVNPYLALKMLTHFNPDFELLVYEWFLDQLLKNRMEGGDAFNTMNGVLFEHFPNKVEYNKFIRATCLQMNAKLGIVSRDTATQAQLQDLAELQKCITDFADTLQDSKQGVKLGFAAFDRRKIRAAEREESKKLN